MIIELTRAYSEPHRHYHTLEHINHMFEIAKKYNVKLTPVLTYAIWFHDAVYRPGSKTNEEDSVALFYQLVDRRELDRLQMYLVIQMILDTKTHELSLKQSEDLLDLDLSILASDSNKYQNYVEGIYKEYFPTSKSDFTRNKKWKEGRLKWVLSMLQREKIFVTIWGKEMEDAARYNLHNERSWLSK